MSPFLVKLIGDSSSLFGLQYLQKLNLAYNGFKSTPIPKGIRNLNYLTHLNLSSAGFGGQVPLQILDISSNPFSGSLESINFSSWEGMVQGSYSQLIHKGLVSFDLYSFGMTLIMKGREEELVKVWSDFSSIDLSSNNFKGEIPNVIGDLSLLHHLNLSHNALNGSIPKSFGKLGELESLDLSQNQLTGAIPTEFARLTFLAFLNVSYNVLVGEIPTRSQLQTFTAESYKGNPGLCGFPLNINCSHSIDESDFSHENEEGKKREIEWEYVSAALGYVVGLASIVWLLVFCRSFRRKYFDKIDDVVEQMFHARDIRRRRAVKNRV